uniref:Cytochrome c oxidase subunit 8A, mitochondrial n=2 Tax=Gouania willdenowi TaxID=441366 RepID=A0A8C5G1K7_GOUWI
MLTMPRPLWTVARRAAPLLRGHTITQRANVYSAPPKEKIGAMETVFALGVFAVTILGPSGWILAHLEDYKNKE